MDEAILIEIAQRFRALEDVAEGLERFRRRHDEMLIDILDFLTRSPNSKKRWKPAAMTWYPCRKPSVALSIRQRRKLRSQSHDNKAGG